MNRIQRRVRPAFFIATDAPISYAKTRDARIDHPEPYCDHSGMTCALTFTTIVSTRPSVVRGCPAARVFQWGASLIEVLIAVLVVSVGLLGIVGLMTVSAKVNLGALRLTQTGLAAQGLMDSMHVNPAAVASGTYDGEIDASTVGADCRRQACDATTRAASDRAQFARAIRTLSVDDKASLKCQRAASCRLAIEVQMPLSATSAGPQTLVWTFRP